MLPFYALTIFFAGMAFFLPQANFHTQHLNKWKVPQVAAAVPTSTPTPTRLPMATPTFTPTPTVVPLKPTAIPVLPTATPTTVPTTSGEQDMLDSVNAYRASQGLSPVHANDVTCSFAKTRAQEITSSFSHDGFQNHINQHALPYASYHMVVENIAMNTNRNDVVDSWIHSPGHAENLRADTPYACIGRSGDYYAYEGWRP